MSSPSENPYAATMTEADAPVHKPGDSAQEVFLAWEKLRLVYNAFLTAASLIVGFTLLADEAFWMFLAEGAIGANLCFCVGPILEGYLTLFGANRRSVRMLIFIIGTIIACLLALAAVSGQFL